MDFGGNRTRIDLVEKIVRFKSKLIPISNKMNFNKKNKKMIIIKNR